MKSDYADKDTDYRERYYLDFFESWSEDRPYSTDWIDVWVTAIDKATSMYLKGKADALCHARKIDLTDDAFDELRERAARQEKCEQCGGTKTVTTFVTHEEIPCPSCQKPEASDNEAMEQAWEAYLRNDDDWSGLSQERRYNLVFDAGWNAALKHTRKTSGRED